LYEAAPAPQRAVSEATAYLMTTMLADVINSGTAWTARREGFTLPAAGKTGTTNDYHDAWFVGFTPKLVAGVWVGYDQPKTIISNGYAAELAVPLWGRFMKAATSGDESSWFRPPPTVTTATICRLSGQLATENCRDAHEIEPNGEVSTRPMVYTEYFVRGTEPEDYCQFHYLHSNRNVLSIFGGAPGHPSPAVVPAPTPQTAAQPAVSPASLPVPERESVKEPETKKRGFWGRIFGRGDKKDDRKDTDKKK
jgi:penicillin-binding protein 2D